MSFLQQLKLRVDSIHKGLSEAKQNYSKCLRSLEVISDDIHQKRKDKKMLAMLANLQEREAGVGADSEDETSLDQSQLDLDLDCNSSLSDVDGILPANLPELPPLPGWGIQMAPGAEVPSGASSSADGAAAELGNMCLGSASRVALERSVSGAESTESVDSDSRASISGSGSFKREVYGCEQEDSEVGECSGNDVPTKETEQNVEVSNTIGESNAIAITTLPETEGSDVLGDGNIASEIVNIPGEIASPINETAEVPEQSETDTTTHQGDEVNEDTQTMESDNSACNQNTQGQECASSDCESNKASDDPVLETEDKQDFPSKVHVDNNNANQREPREVSDETIADNSLEIVAQI